MSGHTQSGLDPYAVLDGSDLASSPTPAEAHALARRPDELTHGLGRAGWAKRSEAKLIGVAAVVLFLTVWQGVGLARAAWPEGLQVGPLLWKPPPALFLPTPTDIWQAYGELIRDGRIWGDIAFSGQELLAGYFLAVFTAIPLGLILGWYPRARYALDPFITFLYATPRIVLLPLLIIWFGIGMNSKIAVVFLGAFFAMVINTTAGVRNLDLNLIKVARSFGASDLQLFRTVALPGSVPFILTGLRLGIGHALTGVVVGELVAAPRGVGQMMATAGATFQSAKVFAGLFIIAGAGMLMTFAIQRLEQRFEAWRPRRT